MITEAEISTALSGYISDHLDAVADVMQETVIKDLPSIVQAVAQTGDVEELRAGIRQSIQRSALGVAVHLQVELSGTLKDALTDMAEHLKALREGVE